MAEAKHLVAQNRFTSRLPTGFAIIEPCPDGSFETAFAII
tara:strand:- start:1575 stop:1694 length:120 start_codon:yes stop_codon:yes gene_type:complete